MALTLVPAYDTPTLTYATLAASAVPTIAGSPGWLREKRVGVAENVPGAAQTSTADLDLTGSTRFRYPGTPAATGYTANPGQYVWTSLKPGASSQAAYWPLNVEFVTSSPTVEFRLNAPVANPLTGRILVNGMPINESPGNAVATAGGGYSMLLTFPDSRVRTITVIGLNNTQGRFGGVAVAAGYTVTKPVDTIKNIGYLGDSYVNGATPVGQTDTFAWRSANTLGSSRAVTLAGVGGTGYLTAIGSDNNSLFINRVTSTLAGGPNAVVLCGGRNDPSAGLQAAAEAVIDALLAGGIARSAIYMSHSCSNSAQAANVTALQAAAASRSVQFINPDNDALPKLGDNVHPTLAGHETLGAFVAAAMSYVPPVPSPDVRTVNGGRPTIIMRRRRR